MVDCFVYDGSGPYAPFHKEGHKGDPKVTPGTCGGIGERSQVILAGVRPWALKKSPTYGD